MQETQYRPYGLAVSFRQSLSELAGNVFCKRSDTANPDISYRDDPASEAILQKGGFNMIDILLSPPIAFIIFLGIFYLIYWLGSLMAPRLKKTPGKTSTYACGEDIPGTKIQFGYRLFFYVALFFTMMHVATLVVATVPGGKFALLSIFYLAMIFLSVLALITRS
ncbi:MAG: hypothetical protein ACPL28_07140 [bacterium]